MSLHPILILSLLASGCAATSSSPEFAPGSLRSFELHDAALLELEARAAPEPIDASAFRLTPPASDATLPTLAQSAAAKAPAPKSPHSFSGGVGIRVRGGESAVDLLAEYHYYVNPKLDIGGIADWAMSPIDSLLIAPAAWWRPSDRLTLFGAPGLEFLSGKGSKAALRLGGSYLLMLGSLAVRPFGWYDFIADRKDSVSFGIAFGV